MYRVEISKSAKRAVRRLPGHVRQRAVRAIEALADDPRHAGARELPGLPGYYRVRLDRWRVIYRVEPDVRRVVILGVRWKTGPEIYEDL